jgi:hypothetical protein
VTQRQESIDGSKTSNQTDALAEQSLEVSENATLVHREPHLTTNGRAENANRRVPQGRSLDVDTLHRALTTG